MIVQEFTLDKLEERVDQKIHHGWIPQGGVSAVPIASDNHAHIYLQAMVKPKAE